MNKILTALYLNKNILISLSLIMLTIYLLSVIPFNKISNVQNQKDLINIKNNQYKNHNKDSEGNVIDKTNISNKINIAAPDSVGGKYVLASEYKSSEYKSKSLSSGTENTTDKAYFTLYDNAINKDYIDENTLYINEQAQNNLNIKYKNNSSKCAERETFGYKSWKIKMNQLVFYCSSLDSANQASSNTETYTFKIIKDEYGGGLLDKSNGKTWRRKEDYSFTYKEKLQDGSDKNKITREVDRRLTLYSIPACDGRSCPAVIEGVFEEKDANGIYKIVKRVPDYTSATVGNQEDYIVNASYGEVQIADSETGIAKIVEVGKNKKALAIYWGDLHQGIDVGGEWLLEYSDLKLRKLLQYKLYESNDGACGKEFNVKCYEYKAEMTIDKNNIDKDGYYKIIAVPIK